MVDGLGIGAEGDISLLCPQESSSAMPVVLCLRPEVVWCSWSPSVETVWMDSIGQSSFSYSFILSLSQVVIIGNDTSNCIFNCNGGGCPHEHRTLGGRKALAPLELVSGSCELPDLGARNQTLILCKSSAYS